MTLWDQLLLFFSVQAILLAVFFYTKKDGNLYANKVFAGFLVLFAYNVFFNMLYWSHFNERLFAALSYTYFIPLSLYGPFYFFFIRSIVTQKKINYQDFVHFIPFFVVLLNYGDYFLLPTDTKLELYRSKTIHSIIYHGAFKHIDYYLTGVLVLYSFLVYFRFHGFYRKEQDLRLWLKIVNLFFILFVSGIVSYYLLTYFEVFKTEYDYYNTISMVIFICIVSYLSVVYPEIINGKPISEVLPLPTVKYEKTGLSQSFSKELSEKLESIMEEQKPYLNHELRLDHVAELLDVSRHHASQVINEHYGLNFFDFINHFRIVEAIKMIEDPKNSLSISDIAYQCGFNNRVSFYKAFKKEKGLTPLEYKAQHLPA